MSRTTGSALTDATPRPLWLDQLGERAARPPYSPSGRTEADVVIVGGGFSGLWTAYHLSELDPTLDIVVLDRHHVGFGASGRNGGWAVGELAASHRSYASRSTPEDALRLERAVMDAVDEIGRVAAQHGIECGYAKGGNIRVATTTPQARRQLEEIEEQRAIGHGPEVIRELTADEAREHLAASSVKGGVWFAPCASLDPARLALGLARAVEERGVTIHEGTTVEAIEDGAVVTNRGRLRARTIVRATEAYTRDLAGRRRDLLPVYSYMVATEPLDSATLDEIGLAGRPTFADDRTMVIYGQRTEDDRIAFGAAGMPYTFGSRIDRDVEFDLESHTRVHTVLVDLLPQLADVAITHRWGGVLGIPRNWTPSVHFDQATGRGTLGGYVGEGVAATQLAGRTLAELIVGEPTERTSLPWVGARSRRWEPEPLRWVGVRASRAILAAADRREARTDREAGLSMRLAGLLRGG